MKEYVRQRLHAALATMEGVPAGFEPELSVPSNPDHGDLATNTAMRLARHLRKVPRAIAEDIIGRLDLDAARVAGCTVAGPGFINFSFAEEWLHRGLHGLLDAGADWGRTRAGAGRRALVEFVSANPTGPLTVGHGRNAVLGDTIAHLLKWTGWEVQREYYFNDAGRQMRVLGRSVRARYEEILAARGELARPPAAFPDDGYRGAYIRDIARTLAERRGASLAGAESDDPFKDAGRDAIFADIARTLRRLDIRMDTYFNERSLYESGAIDEALDALGDGGWTYEADGAVWFRTSALGKDKDTVLVKSTGEPTYRLPDIAYHRDKLRRGYDLLVNVFGADHVATYPDILRALRVTGFDADRVEVVIYQFVTLVRDGQEVKMSTRKADFVTLDELIDEVGEDVTRFFFLMRASASHLEFDLDLAREAGDKNPVFYLQYAHARIRSILRKAQETGFALGPEAELSLLTHEAERSLAQELLRFPEVVERTASSKEPHRIGTYLWKVAEAFTRFYHHCRIIGEERALATARMHLARAASITLANGLAILGISAPERM